jgi:hypothetical protein
VRKILVIALLAAIIITVPIVIAALNSSQIIHISGTGQYPQRTPSPTATPTPSATANPAVQFSLWFQNGTAVPTTISNFPDLVVIPPPPPSDYTIGVPSANEIIMYETRALYQSP